MERLKELREGKGLLQKDIAELLGVDRTTYVKYEKGVNEPSNDNLLKLADFFGVTTDYLLGREQNISSPNNLDLSERQMKVLNAYTSHPEMQSAVDKLLGIDELEYPDFLKHKRKTPDPEAYIAAFGGNIQVPDDSIDTPPAGREALDRLYNEEIKRENNKD